MIQWDLLVLIASQHEHKNESIGVYILFDIYGFLQVNMQTLKKIVEGITEFT